MHKKRTVRKIQKSKKTRKNNKQKGGAQHLPRSRLSRRSSRPHSPNTSTSTSMRISSNTSSANKQYFLGIQSKTLSNHLAHMDTRGLSTEQHHEYLGNLRNLLEQKRTTTNKGQTGITRTSIQNAIDEAGKRLTESQLYAPLSLKEGAYGSLTFSTRSSSSGTTGQDPFNPYASLSSVSRMSSTSSPPILTIRNISSREEVSNESGGLTSQSPSQSPSKRPGPYKKASGTISMTPDEIRKMSIEELKKAKASLELLSKSPNTNLSAANKQLWRNITMRIGIVERKAATTNQPKAATTNQPVIQRVAQSQLSQLSNLPSNTKHSKNMESIQTKRTGQGEYYEELKKKHLSARDKNKSETNNYRRQRLKRWGVANSNQRDINTIEKELVSKITGDIGLLDNSHINRPTVRGMILEDKPEALLPKNSNTPIEKEKKRQAREDISAYIFAER